MRISIASSFAIVAIIIFFAFPKAGVYVGDVPLTLGYGLLAITGGWQLLRLARHGRPQVRADYLILGILFFLLATVEAVTFAKYGFASLGTLFSILASTLVVPALGVLSVHVLIDALGMERFMRMLRISLAIVFVFGMVSFAIYNTLGVVVGIPCLTTTGEDIHTVADRHNLRGPVIKMFSTYNNGNILGINMLLWGAVAAAGTKFSLWQYRSICILTLSRSVWLGLALMEIISSVVQRSVLRILVAGVLVACLTVVYVAASWFIGRDPLSFLFDRNLGGRVVSFQDSIYGANGNRVGWTNESLYAAAFLAFGPVGTVLISAIWLFPIFRGGRSPIEVNCRIALAVYMMVACAEAAFNLVPTQSSYWMIAGIAMGAGRSQASLIGATETAATTTTTAASPMAA